MTALYFETEDGTQLKTAIFDGYFVGDRILEGVHFIVTIKEDGTLDAVIHPSDKCYFETLNTKYWMDKVIDYIQDYDVFEHPENGEDVCLVTDEPQKEVVAVVGKSYTWEEVLQNMKNKKTT